MPATELSLTGTPLPEPLDFTRSGMPSLDAVHTTVPFTPEPGGQTYQILKTTEFDSYESSPATEAVAKLVQQGQPSPADLLAAAQPAVLGDDFAGTARKVAKLSIGTGRLEQFADVSKLIASLPADSSMVHHTPPIDTSSTSARVVEEQRTVHVTGFLYAASRESDNDYHLIVGLDPATHPDTYMTMEVSGLPPANSPAFAKIKAARDSFQTFFGAHAPMLTYDYYHPPIPVVVEGSLFFDMTHAVGEHPGPPSLKSRMPTIWEVHAVTMITLGSHP